MLTDVHAHFLTERYVREAKAAGHLVPDGMPAWPQWSVDAHLELMDAEQIRKAILSISSPGVEFGGVELCRHVNDTAAEVVARYPDRFGFFASLPLPDITESVREMDRLPAAAGVVVESNISGKYWGDNHFEPLLAEWNNRETVVFVHPTSPPCSAAVALDRPRPMLEFFFDTTRNVSDLLLSGALERYPGIRFIIPHCGAALPMVADRMDMFAMAFSGDALPVRELLSGLWYDLAGTPFPRHAPALAELVGTEKLLYGSDFCFTPPVVVAAQIAGITAAPGPDWPALTTANAERLFDRIT